MAKAEDDESKGVFDNSEGSVKLLVGSGESKRYLDDRAGLRDRLSDYVFHGWSIHARLPRPATTSWKEYLQESSAAASSTRQGLRRDFDCRL